MNAAIYRLAELLAAATGAWCVIEVALRIVTGATAGLAATGFTALAAAAMFALAGARRRSIGQGRDRLW